MSITISPPVADIDIGSTHITNSDWESNTPGAISTMANALATQQVLLSTVGTVTKSISGNVVLNDTESANLNFIITGALSGAARVLLDVGFEGIAYFVNKTSGGFAITVGLDNGAGSPAGTLVTVTNGGNADIFCDGTDVSLRELVYGTFGGAGVTGTLTVSGAATFGSTGNFTGNVSVGGALNVTGTAGITGAVTGSSTATFTGAINTGGSLGASGSVSAGTTIGSAGNGTIGGNLNVGGTLGTSGSVSFGANSGVAGNEIVSGNVDVGGSLGVTGDVTTANMHVGNYLFIKDAQLYIYLDIDGNAVLNVDSGDLMKYDRTANEYQFFINGAKVFTISASGGA